MEDYKNKIIFKNNLHGIKQIADKSTPLVIADPPYFLGLTSNGQRGSFSDMEISEPFFRSLIQEVKRILTDDGELYWFCDFRSYAFYYPIIEAVIPVKNLIVWDKISGPGNHYTFTHEFIIFSAKGNPTKKGTNIWRVRGFQSGAKKTDGEQYINSQKPKAVIAKIVENASRPGDLVVDLFCGSGTTPVVCREMNRDFISFENKREHYMYALERMESVAIQESLFDRRQGA